MAEQAFSAQNVMPDMKKNQMPTALYYNFYGKFGQIISPPHRTKKAAMQGLARSGSAFTLFKAAVKFVPEKKKK